MKLRGTVKFEDIGSGAYVLVCDDGQQYQLNGAAKGLRSPGKRMEVDGSVDESAVTAGMLGQVFNVLAFKIL